MKLPTLCTPAMVYLVLSIVAMIVGAKMLTIVHVLLVLLWTFLLNFLCSKGYKTVSWILVLLPIVVAAMFIVSMGSLSFVSVTTSTAAAAADAKPTIVK
jgi:hypothetical protein